MESEEEKDPYVHFLNQDSSKAICIVQVYLQASLLLLEHSFRLSSAVQLSGKAHKDSNCTIVIAIVY